MLFDQCSSDVCLVIAAYNETFVDGEKKCPDVDSQMASDKLVEFLRKMVGRFFDLLRQRVRYGPPWATFEHAGFF